MQISRYDTVSKRQKLLMYWRTFLLLVWFPKERALHLSKGLEFVPFETMRYPGNTTKNTIMSFWGNYMKNTVIFVVSYQILLFCQIWWFRYRTLLGQWINATLRICTDMQKLSSQKIRKQYCISIVKGEVIYNV